MRYLCVDYPQLRVLIERRPKEAQDHFAQFERGTYETEDPKEIEVLDKTERVHRADSVKPEDARIIVKTDDGEQVIKLAKAKRQVKRNETVG